ncbi:putative thioesterase atnL [Cladobotryum mycophilum]|uniref:Thioesterase atnL n=1 Tax=Cladobotryum mycophilum TaxID=491253 RepID=A0ABR0SJH5_9HYPO
MSSTTNKLGGLSVAVSAVSTLALGSTAYAAWKVNWHNLVQSFLTGPGRASRILLLLFVIFNWKNMPFAWTYRIFYAMLYHSVFRKSPELGPRALFKPMISETKAPIFEIDYNIHKSNSTYFADLDVSRTHLVAYLLRPAIENMSNNVKTKLVMDPKTGQPVRGSFSIALGSVMCTFKREIAGFKTYELWSRIACWDRKWLYIVTHFVPKGTAKPTEWLDPGFRKVKTRSHTDATSGWEKKIHATAISKYVFKIGRLTVHPAVALSSAGLLPERPGGWIAGENQVGDESMDLGDIDLAVEDTWDWRRVEAQRRKGMELASQFHNLDNLHDTFDGGSNGAIARFIPG